MKGKTIEAGVYLACALLATSCSDTPSAPEDLPEPGTEGFRTEEPALARGLGSATVTPLVTVGDVVPGSDEAVAPSPDGVGVREHGGQLLLYLSHELGGVPLVSGGEAYSRGRVSRLVLDRETVDVLEHEFLIDGSEGFRAFSSGAWVDERDGFPGGYFFTGEKVHNGVQLAIDRDGRVIEMRGLGRFNHDSQIAVPGFPGHVVLLNFEDAGGTEFAQSELYMYAAGSVDQALAGDGQLYVYRSDAAAHAGQLTVGQSVSGAWVAVPDEVAQDDEALQAFARDQGTFSFVRLEDGFYDKRSGAPPSVYFFDTGRSSITNGTGRPLDKWGSIYRVVFEDPGDPGGGAATLTLVARSDGPDAGWASPDNGDMRSDGVIMLQEDPAAGVWQRPPSIFRLQLAADGSLVQPAGTRIVEVTDPACPGDACSDVRVWETSGIVDTSPWLGPGTWLFTVMAHDKPVPALDLAAENGQLLLLEEGL